MKLVSVFNYCTALLLLASCNLEKVGENPQNETVITFDTTVVTSQSGDAGVGVAQFKDGTYLIGAYGGKQIIHLSKEGNLLDAYEDNGFWVHDMIYKAAQDEVVVCGFNQPVGSADQNGVVRSFKGSSTPNNELVISDGSIQWVQAIVQSNSGDYSILGHNASNHFTAFVEAQFSSSGYNSDNYLPYSDFLSNLIQTKTGNYVYSSLEKNTAKHLIVKTKPNKLIFSEIEWTFDAGAFYPITIIESQGNYVCAGEKDEKPYVMVLSPSKVVLFEDQLGGGAEGSLSDIKALSNGGFILSGAISGINSNGGYDFYLVKLKADFNVEWERYFGGALDESGRGVANTSDGGFIIVGSSKSFGNGENDVYVVKTDRDGMIR